MSEAQILLADPEAQLLAEIASPAMKQRDIISTYGLALRTVDLVDWPKVNRAIVTRWSLSGLARIKASAWQRHEHQQLEAQLAAADEFIAVWGQLLKDLSSEHNCHLTCGETEAVARLLKAFGASELADQVVAAHAASDGPEDEHWIAVNP